MPRHLPLLLAALATTACATAGPDVPPPLPPLLGAASGTPPESRFTPADVEFMAGMIPHHAQAVRMARLAASNEAGPAVRLLAERILVSQHDEIEFMRVWLRARGQYVPPPDATHHRHTMPDGTEHAMLMPGMLTDDELAQLARARGTAFDRLFLSFMIRHHEGALVMVEQLFASPGAAHDEELYTFASDVFADQTSEIERMQRMLEALPPAGS